MTSRYLLRENHQGRIVPRADLGLHASRKEAKRAATALGLPAHLITTVRRRSA